eukprot:5640542-Amphidinium_carterae.1
MDAQLSDDDICRILCVQVQARNLGQRISQLVLRVVLFLISLYWSKLARWHQFQSSGFEREFVGSCEVLVIPCYECDTWRRSAKLGIKCVERRRSSTCFMQAGSSFHSYWSAFGPIYSGMIAKESQNLRRSMVQAANLVVLEIELKRATPIAD